MRSTERRPESRTAPSAASRARAPAAAALLGTIALVGACFPVRGPHGKRAAPPNVQVTCSLEPDRAVCLFENRGGPGDRCVVLLVGAPATRTVVASAEVCAGPLDLAGIATAPAPLPRRPADLCGPDLSGCTVRVASPGRAADRAAAAWRAELEASPAPPPSLAECRDLVDRLFRLAAPEWARRARTAGERASAPGEVAALRARFADALVARCHNDLTRRQLECARRSRSLAEVRRCAP